MGGGKKKIHLGNKMLQTYWIKLVTEEAPCTKLFFFWLHWVLRLQDRQGKCDFEQLPHFLLSRSPIILFCSLQLLYTVLHRIGTVYIAREILEAVEAN